MPETLTPPPTPETNAAPPEPEKKLSVRALRDLASSLIKENDPRLPADQQNELRTKALASLFIELCDRTHELWSGTGMGIKRLSDHVEGIDQDLAALAAQAPAPPETPDAKTKPKNGKGKDEPPPPPSVPIEVAAIPAPGNGLVPAMPPGVTVTVKP